MSALTEAMSGGTVGVQGVRAGRELAASQHRQLGCTPGGRGSLAGSIDDTPIKRLRVGGFIHCVTSIIG